jgi:hypothetical protein
MLFIRVRSSSILLASLSKGTVWNEYFNSSWLDRITRMTGDSSTVIDQWVSRGLPEPEFGFVDAGHRYEEVWHDFYAFLSICAPRPVILFDDYSPRRGFGIKRLIDSEVAPVFDTELIRTEWRTDGSAGRDAEVLEGMALVEPRPARDAGASGLPPDVVKRRLANSRCQLRLLVLKDRARSILRPIARGLRVR